MSKKKDFNKTAKLDIPVLSRHPETAVTLEQALDAFRTSQPDDDVTREILQRAAKRKPAK